MAISDYVSFDFSDKTIQKYKKNIKGYGKLD